MSGAESVSLGGTTVAPGKRARIDIPIGRRASGAHVSLLVEVVIGRSELPIVNEGDAIFHIATFNRPEDVAESVDEFNDALSDIEEG